MKNRFQRRCLHEGVGLFTKRAAGDYTKGIERETSWSYQNPKGFDENNGKTA